jgi:hypothetical protein
MDGLELAGRVGNAGALVNGKRCGWGCTGEVSGHQASGEVKKGSEVRDDRIHAQGGRCMMILRVDDDRKVLNNMSLK